MKQKYEKFSKFIINPFYLYSGSWLFTLCLYNLYIIKVFPKLSTTIFNFIIITIFISFIFGTTYKIKKIKINERSQRNIFLIIIIGWLLTFFKEGKIPLIEILLRTGYSYTDFRGIPTFSMLIYTLTTFNAIDSYVQYLYFKKKENLYFSIMDIIFYILIYRRGMVLYILIGLFILNLYYYFNFKRMILTIFTVIVLMYGFGIAGNIRHGFKYNDTSVFKHNIQLKTRKSVLDPFLWSYTYITSPLSNLEYSYKIKNKEKNILEFFKRNFLPDFIQKRLSNKNMKKIKLLIPAFTVQTMYNSAYVNFGVEGMYISCFIYFLSMKLYLFIIKNNNYLLSALIILCLINIFSIFTNMYVFSGLSFCLIYPFIFSFINKIKKFNKKGVL